PRPIYLLERLNQGPRPVDDLPPLPPSTDGSRSSSVAPPKGGPGDDVHQNQHVAERGFDGETSRNDAVLDQDPFTQVVRDSSTLPSEEHQLPATLDPHAAENAA